MMCALLLQFWEGKVIPVEIWSLMLFVTVSTLYAVQAMRITEKLNIFGKVVTILIYITVLWQSGVYMLWTKLEGNGLIVN